MKVYITKFALTQGIIEKEVEATHTPNMVVDKSSNCLNAYHKPYWFDDKNDAIKHANLLKERKIISLEKELAKIKALTFK